MSNLVSRKSRLAAILATAALSLGLMAGPASAANGNAGLVVVDVDNVLNNNDVTVQLPIAVAANVCDVDVNLLAAQIVDEGSAQCDAQANSRANNPRNR